MDYVQALLLTLIAGLCTGIGSCIAFFTKKSNKTFLSVSLGFSAGVMIYVSMIEIFGEAQKYLIHELGEMKVSWLTVISFLGGMLIIAIIDKLVPEEENPHKIRKFESVVTEDYKLKRMGVFYCYCNSYS